MGFWSSIAATPLRLMSGAWGPWLPAGGGTDGLEAGASRRRLSGFRPGTKHVNTLIAGAGRTVLERARWLVRNNPYAMNAVDWFGGTSVGAGISPTWLVEDEGLRKRLRSAWDDWTDEADAEGLTDFYGLQRRASREVFLAGEVFLRLRYRLPSDGLTVPLQLQMLPSEMLDASDNRTLANGNLIRQGIEFNRIGSRVAYWFWRVHPGDSTDTRLPTDKVRVAAGDVIHLMDPVEAGQIRGLSRFANVTAKLFTLDQYDDAELERKKTAALFAGFIKKQLATDPLPINPQEGVDPSLQSAGYDDTTAIAGLEAGTMQVLNAGEEVVFSEPSDVGGSYDAFQYRNLLAISAGLGVPYFAMTGDIAKANFASSRAQQVDTKRRIEAWQWSVMIFAFCRPVIAAWLTQAALSSSVPGLTVETLRGANGRALRKVRWMTPPWLWVDPLKDMQADKMAVDNGFKSRSDVIEANGYDAAETDRRIAEDKAREAKLGLSFPQAKDGPPPPPADDPAPGAPPPGEAEPMKEAA